jgi:hypothetical protein
MKRHLIPALASLGLIACLAAYYFTGKNPGISRGSMPKAEPAATPAAEVPGPAIPQEDNETILISAPPEPLSAEGQEANETAPAGTPPASLPGPMVWTVTDVSQLQKNAKELFLDIYGMRKAQPLEVPGRLRSIVANMAALAIILDGAPNKPLVFANVMPPVLRADGTRYSSQMLFSGMAPDAIQDAEQRAAYLQAIAQRNADATLASWLMQANTKHRSLHSSLEDELAFLVKRGVISVETQKQSLAASGRQRGLAASGRNKSR